MNKKEFLHELARLIGDLPHNEVEKAISFYSENIDDRIDDGFSETDAVAALGNLDDIAREIRANASLTSIVASKIKESKDRASNKTVWLALIILGSPIWITLLFCLVAVVFSIFITIVAIIFSLFALVFSFAISAILGLGYGIFTMITLGLLQGMSVIGGSIALAGLFILTFKPLLIVTKKLSQLMGSSIGYCKSKILSRRTI